MPPGKRFNGSSDIGAGNVRELAREPALKKREVVIPLWE
jgi:hypothetical protein